MKEYVEVIQGADHCHTELLLKVTSSQACKKKRKNILENVTNVKDSLQTFTSLEEFLILFPALGLLLNRVLIL